MTIKKKPKEPSPLFAGVVSSADLINSLEQAAGKLKVQVLPEDEQQPTFGPVPVVDIEGNPLGMPQTVMPQPAIEPVEHKAVATTTVKNADGSETSSEEAVGKPKLFTSPPCNVGVTAKLTIPLAPYTTAQVGVSLNVPCAHGEIDEVYDFAKSWVDTRMSALAEEVKGVKV